MIDVLTNLIVAIICNIYMYQVIMSNILNLRTVKGQLYLNKAGKT